MKPLPLGRLLLGSGRPKVCVPLVARDEAQIRAQAQRIQASPAEICEWRADFYEGVQDLQALGRILPLLKEMIAPRPLLFTIRTHEEGGAVQMEGAAYAGACILAAQHAQAVDVQFFVPGAKEIVRQVQACGAKAIVSSHDFEKTPGTDEMKARLRAMEEMRADVVKLAVMPQNAQDVLRLLDLTAWAKEACDCPVITMAMGELGKISRVAGEVFGSAMTFGSLGEQSAPGQLDVDTLMKVLDALSCREGGSGGEGEQDAGNKADKA